MSAFYGLYRALGWPLLSGLFRVAAVLIPKVREGLEARAQLPSGEKPWASGPSFPGAVWIHCASGEFEYAKPVITLLKAERPSTRVLVTYFSTSYRKAVAAFTGVDHACPLPWDTPKALQEFLSYHKPSQLLVARTDVWPEMARQARLSRLPSLLFSATLTSQSGRARGLGRWVSRATFSQLDSIFAVSEEDTNVFRSLGLEGTDVRKAGDTRYDQVVARLRSPKPVKDELFRGAAGGGVDVARPTGVTGMLGVESHAPIVVCGSTWPEDEAVLIPAIAAFGAVELRLRDEASGRLKAPRFVLVPHEATPEHLSAIEAQLSAAGLTSTRYTQATSWTEGVLIIDTMGILAELYLKADYAFVGGSFKKNIHSVMEPLAAGCLTLVGPKHANNREALALKEVEVANLDPALSLASGLGSGAGSDVASRASSGNPKIPGTSLSCVQPIANADEFVSALTKAMQLPIEKLKSAIRSEIEARTGASRLVVDWIQQHAGTSENKNK